jgi:type II secretory pathway component PulC
MMTIENETKRRSKLTLGFTWALVALSLAFAGQARAADNEAENENQLEEAELEARLDEAQLRLEEAARQVAELSSQLIGDATVIALGSVREALAPRPMLGINIAAAGENGNAGVLVEGVVPDGPAAEAGIQRGDILVEIDGKSLEGGESGSGMRVLSDHMDEIESGVEMIVRYVRDGTSQTATVEPRNMDPIGMAFSMSGDWDFDFEDLESLEALEALEELEALAPHHPAGTKRYKFRLGHAAYWGDMELVTLTPELGEYFGAEEGILVVRAPGEEALQLQDGDVIVEIDGRKPTDPAHAMRILRSYDAGENLTLGIVRQKKRRSLDIDLPAPDLGAYQYYRRGSHPADGEIHDSRRIILGGPERT